MLIKGFDKIQRREMLDCRMKTLKEMVRHCGVDLSSFYIFLLSESFSFRYGIINFPELSIWGIPYAVSSDNEVEAKLFCNIGMEYIRESVDATDIGWNKMKSLIDNEMPIIARIDGRLFHQSSTTIPCEKKIKIHYLSSILVVGYSQDNNSVKIVLTNTNQQDEPVEISKEQFQQYRQSVCIPFSPNCECFYLEKNPKLQFSQNEIKERILCSLSRTARKMILGQNDQICLKDFDCQEIQTGLEGLGKLCADLEEQYRIFKKTKRDEHWKKHIIFSVLFLRNNLMFGSYSSYREEFGNALLQFSNEYDCPELQVVGNKFISSSLLWKKWFSLAGQLPHSKHTFAFCMAKLLMTLKKILRIERGAFLRLNKCIERHFEQ